MQPRPTAHELLAIVAEVLERDLVPALTGPAQHHARVAASLVGIVERELRLGPAAADHETIVLRRLIGAESDNLLGLRARLARDLRGGLADDPARAAEIWPALMEFVRADLSIVKPGHDSWEGE